MTTTIYNPIKWINLNITYLLSIDLMASRHRRNKTWMKRPEGQDLNDKTWTKDLKGTERNRNQTYQRKKDLYVFDSTKLLECNHCMMLK